jgi:hypothetical protein
MGVAKHHVTYGRMVGKAIFRDAEYKFRTNSEGEKQGISWAWKYLFMGGRKNALQGRWERVHHRRSEPSTSMGIET